jgi:5'-nucleotidase
LERNIFKTASTDGILNLPGKTMIEMTEQPQELQERFKKFTILHSNDMHGDFLAEAKGAEGNLIGGLALVC